MDPTEKKGGGGEGEKEKETHGDGGWIFPHFKKEAVPTTLYILNAFLLSSCLPLLLLLWHVGYIADVCVYVYVYAYVLCLLYL